METIFTKSGIEVCYPCIVHLLRNGENFECEYKSDSTGQDLMDSACRIQKIKNKSFWGLKFMDTSGMEDKRFWLDLNNLIRSQVKNVQQPRFYFRTKIYPPDPYKIQDTVIRRLLFQQLRLDLLSGRLFCTVDEAAMLSALILQRIHGNFDCKKSWTYLCYWNDKILRQERCPARFFSATKLRTFEIYEKLLTNLQVHETEDMFLRLASKLDSYGVEPFIVRNIERQDVIMWMNYTGLTLCGRNRRKCLFSWNDIFKITHESTNLFVHLNNKSVIVIECLSNSECDYIWSLAVDHLIYFTSTVVVNACVGIETCVSENQEVYCDFNKTFDPTFVPCKYAPESPVSDFEFPTKCQTSKPDPGARGEYDVTSPT
ncbi:FERM domain-containing protein 5-like [Rhynchophorus ferrugineus]|uniref:FERM domain-containing protein 5-like n=1 Tax=Rhynchophorus ferrugineus TaxID=354439 RepID=UPI003FCDF682